MEFQRKAGILLHPTSLPGPYGIGEIGVQAREFADRLREMGVGLWQMLPLGPTGYGDSPYQSLSTFAGNTMLICLDQLVADGYLPAKDLAGFPRFPEDRVDYGPVIPARTRVLQMAADKFARRATAFQKADFQRFCDANADWLEDFALFQAIKESEGLRPWTQWPAALARREPAALKEFARAHSHQVKTVRILQFLFDQQWRQLKAHCNEQGIQLVGDIPIFVAHDSADTWANPDLFYLNPDGSPTVVAGVPPDYFSATGQLWGNPLYRWDVHKQSDYAWWIRRMKKILSLVDIVRIDHFRGFEAYWEIPGGEPTAMNGRWVPGPGADFFESLRRQMGDLPVIAEDLGVITPGVEALRDGFNLPGMRILQFAFGSDDQAENYKPHSYPPNCVVYTGTHDNDTTVGWFRSEPGQGSTRSREEIDRERNTVLGYVHTDGSQIHWDLISLAFRSKAATSVVPLQDVFGLGSEARMNTPGTTSGNWGWRFAWDALDSATVRRMRDLVEFSGRL